MAEFIIMLDTSKFEARLEKMLEQLKEFPNQMGEELTAWQTEDMHRKYPNTEVNPDYVETKIWPTSRAQERDPQKVKRAIRAMKTQSSTTYVRVKGQSTRPILRPMLYEMLAVRMDLLMSSRLSWKGTG